MYTNSFLHFIKLGSLFGIGCLERFKKEKKTKPIVYGLVDQVDSFNPLYL